MIRKKLKKGFTLLEIVVVVAIVAVITVAIIIAVETARNRTRDAVIISSLEQIQAIGKTVYNRETEYKELEDHPDVENIRAKITGELGRSFNLKFPEGAANPSVEDYGYDRYCAYVYLFQREELFCVDSTGFKGRVDVSGGKEISCSSVDSLPYSCEYD